MMFVSWFLSEYFEISILISSIYNVLGPNQSSISYASINTRKRKVVKSSHISKIYKKIKMVPLLEFYHDFFFLGFHITFIIYFGIHFSFNCMSLLPNYNDFRVTDFVFVPSLAIPVLDIL